jgi:hypothetical protein
LASFSPAKLLPSRHRLSRTIHQFNGSTVQRCPRPRPGAVDSRHNHAWLPDHSRAISRGLLRVVTPLLRIRTFISFNAYGPCYACYACYGSKHYLSLPLSAPLRSAAPCKLCSCSRSRAAPNASTLQRFNASTMPRVTPHVPFCDPFVTPRTSISINVYNGCDGVTPFLTPGREGSKQREGTMTSPVGAALDAIPQQPIERCHTSVRRDSANTKIFGSIWRCLVLFGHQNFHEARSSGGRQRVASAPLEADSFQNR